MIPLPTLHGGDLLEELEANSSSTKLGYDTGTRKFNKFATHQEVKELRNITFEDCTENDANLIEKLFRQFTSFLIEYKRANDKHIKPDCQFQYLSGAMNIFRKKCKKAMALKEGMDDNLVSDGYTWTAIRTIQHSLNLIMPYQFLSLNCSVLE